MACSLDPTEWLELRDGARIGLRPIRPSDGAALMRAFERMSPRSRHQRFLATKTGLSEADLRSLTRCDGQMSFALVAMAGSPADGTPELAGAARFIRLGSDSSTAEIALAVVDAWQRRGIGHVLLRRIAAEAVRHGITRLEGLALADNRDVLRLVESIGRETNRHYEDGLVRFRCTLRPDPPLGLDGLYAEWLRRIARRTISFPLVFGWGPVLEVLRPRPIVAMEGNDWSADRGRH